MDFEFTGNKILLHMISTNSFAFAINMHTKQKKRRESNTQIEVKERKKKIHEF